MWLFYLLAALVICLGVLSLRSGLRFAAYVRSQLTQLGNNFSPYASVIVPCRGLEPGLAGNLAALFEQSYPEYELLFVTDSEIDPALGIIQKLIREQTNRISARALIAGMATDCGQKVHNLRAAVAQTDPSSEVLVFLDSDVHPQKNWLAALIDPLADTEIGAASGYRWFVPMAGFASYVRSVWNASIASALGKDRKSNFCWGGSTAIRRETFDHLKITERWRGSVSDDFTLTRVLAEASLPIHFVPACLVASATACDLRELLEFTNRQLKITRVYAAHLWRPVLLGSALFSLVFFGGIVLVVMRALLGLSFTFPLTLIVIIFLLGAGKSFVRFRSVALVIPGKRANSLSILLAHLFLWPLASLLYLVNAIAAAFSRKITWRGITYELKSPSEVVIIRGDGEIGE